ncbi:MAG TPA: glycosyltransferase family 4 protein [Polyangia bacterium]|jgi:glycosyltransferase involved in cell wall biosynthesis
MTTREPKTDRPVTPRRAGRRLISLRRPAARALTVLHLRADSAVYGAERVILTLVKEQLRRGLNAHVLCLERAGASAFYELLQAEGVPATRVESTGRVDGQALRTIQGVIDEQIRPDILHSHGYKTDAFLALMKRFLRRRTGLVATNHLWTHETVALRLYEIIDTFAFWAFDRVVAVSAEIGREMATRGVAADKIRVILNGLSYAPQRADRGGTLHAELGATAPGSLIVGFVGRLSVQKGLGFLLAAAARLRARRNVYFALIGEGPLRADLEAELAASGLRDRVRLLGRRDDVPDLLRQLDVVVLPSLREGTPIALLEAMGAGRAVVASDVGGVKDVVEHGRTGLIVPPTDVPALADALAHLLDHRPARLEMGRAAAVAVRARFSDTIMAQSYLELYEHVAA